MNSGNSKQLTLIFLLVVLLIVSLMATFGWFRTWSILHVPTTALPYADLRTVQGGLASLSAGHDPQVNNPGDPWARPMNYPSIWLDIARVLHLGNEVNYVVVVTAFVFIYLASCYFFLRAFPSVWVLLTVLSGASLLGIEKGNNDIVVFSILFLAGIASSLSTCATLIFVASVLKIYPVFAFPAVLHRWRWAAALLLGAACYFLLIRDEISAIRAGTPLSVGLTYGAPSLSELIRQKTGIDLSYRLIGGMLMMLSLIASRVIGTSQQDVIANASDRSRRFFLMGSGIYLLSFLLSSNFDYRLIFLTFCIPYICGLGQAVFRSILLVSIVISCNKMYAIGILGIVGSGLNTSAKMVVFVMLSTLTLNELFDLWKRGRFVAGT